MKNIWIVVAIFLSFSTLQARIDYSTTAEGRAFVEKMHKRYKFDKRYIYKLLKKAKHQQKTLNRYRGRHKVGSTDFSWHRYKSKILIKDSINLGRKFMQRNRKYLLKASKKYRVSPAIITAFIRVESKFGMYGREYNVWDSLVTLAFNHNRKQRFFRGELESLLILTRKNRLNPLNLRGSFAGAMGVVQQVPSIQLKYAVDMDRDGRKDPQSIADGIGSIASFLHRNGWRDNRITVVRASYNGKRFRGLKTGYRSRYKMSTITSHGIKPRANFPYKSAYLMKLRDTNYDELYLGSKNYRIITRYNASARYAVTIALYAKAMEKEWKSIQRGRR